MGISVYFVRGNTLGIARRYATTSLRLQSLRDVMAGPSAAEKAEGLTSAVGPGSAVEGYTVVKGVGYVDFNTDFYNPASALTERQRLAQVIYTLTSFPDIKTVLFRLKNKNIPEAYGGINLDVPLSRASLLSTVGPVLLLSPAVGEPSHPTLLISGQAQFDGTLQIELLSSTRRTLISAASTAITGETFTYRYPMPREASPSTLRVYAAPSVGGTQLVASVTIAPSS